MKGEYCIAGASFFSFISVVLMVFTIIGQINPTSLPKGIYFVKMNVAAFGAGLESGTKTSAGGLYMTDSSQPLGKHLGLRQEYRWGMLNSCAYTNDGGRCNSTSLFSEFEPLAVLLSDTPTKFVKQTSDIIPSKDASNFKNDSYNGNLSKVAYGCIFAGACASALALIFGVVPSRLTFAISAVMSVIATLTLVIGAAIWTVLINKDNFVNKVKVSGGKSLGITISSGPALYLTWVAFAFSALSIFPYVVSTCTYRRN